MDPVIYGLAVNAATAFLNAQIAARPNGLYATWLSHVTTIQNVLEAFEDELENAGVIGGAAQQPYLSAFKRQNGIDDNYYA